MNITAAGDFPWMMPQWKDVSGEHEQPRAVADRQARRASKRAARSSRFPPTRATFAISRTRARRPSTSRRGRPTASSSRTSAIESGEYALYIESQDGLDAAARDQDSDDGPLLHGRVVARRQADHVPRHEPEAVGRGRRDGPGEGRRQRSVDGADAHDESGVVAGRQVDRVREASEFALQRDRGRERRDGRVEAGDRRPGRRRHRRRGTRAASICGSSRRPTSVSSRSGST